MGIISIKCVITRVSDSRAPGPLEYRWNARARILFDGGNIRETRVLSISLWLIRRLTQSDL